MTTPDRWDADVNARAARFARNIARPRCLRCDDTGRVYAGVGSYGTRDDDQPCPDCYQPHTSPMAGWE